MEAPPVDSNSLDASPQDQRRRGKASFGTQAGALFRKNAVQQRRAWVTSCFLVCTPIFFCVLLFVLQKVINRALDTPDNKCGCLCTTCCSSATGVEVCRPAGVGSQCLAANETCRTYDTEQCGLQYSDSQQANWCQNPSPSSWPALMQAASEGFLAQPWAPAAPVLYTGAGKEAADEMAGRMFTAVPPSAVQREEAAALLREGADSGNFTVYAAALSYSGIALASWQKFPFLHYYIEPAFVATGDYNATLYGLVPDASNPAAAAAVANISRQLGELSLKLGGAVGVPTVSPVTLERVFRNSSSAIDSDLYCGYSQARCDGVSAINAFLQAWDFGSTSPANGLDVRMWYNATGRYGVQGNNPVQLLRLNQGINQATNAFLSWALGPAYSARLLGMMSTPKPAGRLTLDFNALLGPIFYTWLLQLLLPVMLVGLVYEKERGLRGMMKMHGLGDGAYWAIQYLWYFAINFAYVWVLIGFGSLIRLSFFTATAYGFQFVFYLLWINCLIGFAFLLSALFRSSRTAVVVAFLYVFGTGLVGYLLLEQFVSRNHWWVIFLELIPGFALYRGLYEISQYAFRAAYQNNTGLSFAKLSDPNCGVGAVMIIFVVEWLVFMALAWYLEQVVPTGAGAPRHPLFFLGKFRHGLSRKKGGKGAVSPLEPGDETVVPLEAEDVAAERARVDALSGAADASQALSIHDLAKTFPPTRGTKEKAAVRGLTLAIARGECFGLLGPNGAGKSTALNCLTGTLEPTSGTAVVAGHDIRSDLNAVYSLMGVCPQDNLLWEALTAREHVLFYGRLKNLKGAELAAAVDAALRSVNLLNGGTGDKQVRTYSGGMKRRLSVAISLVGDPSVVYMDEPSTGLDPASRQNLWDAVKRAKRGRGIILTTHSMEEATVLCDRLGIFVDGQLVCIGSPQELTARHGGYYVFTITTRPEGEADADALVRRMSPGARLTYALAGTRKYELPAQDVSLAEVFREMERVGGELGVLDWGVHSASLEEVFIAFAQSIGAEGGN